MKIVVGISGASGAIYGYRLIEFLQKKQCEIHAVISKHGWQVLEYECGILPADIRSKVDFLHDVDNIGASIASGSFKTDAMVIVPCSMKTLGSIAHGLADNLLSRAADVALKEGRKLILVPREAPFNAIHLENMLKLAQLGVRILPACPGFYHRPATLDDIINMLVGKICDSIGIEHDLFLPWTGDASNAEGKKCLHKS